MDCPVCHGETDTLDYLGSLAVCAHCHQSLDRLDSAFEELGFSTPRTLKSPQDLTKHHTAEITGPNDAASGGETQQTNARIRVPKSTSTSDTTAASMRITKTPTLTPKRRNRQSPLPTTSTVQCPTPVPRLRAAKASPLSTPARNFSPDPLKFSLPRSKRKRATPPSSSAREVSPPHASGRSTRKLAVMPQSSSPDATSAQSPSECVRSGRRMRRERRNSAASPIRDASPGSQDAITLRSGNRLGRKRTLIVTLSLPSWKNKATAQTESRSLNQSEEEPSGQPAVLTDFLQSETRPEVPSPMTPSSNSHATHRVSSAVSPHAPSQSWSAARVTFPRSLQSPPEELGSLITTLQEVPAVIKNLNEQYMGSLNAVINRQDFQERRIAALVEGNRKLSQRIFELGGDPTTPTEDRVGEIEERLHALEHKDQGRGSRE